MQMVTLSREEVARLGKALYIERIRSQVETDENIGKMVIIDIDPLHPTVPVTFRLPGYPDLTIEFVVDTGFVGFLTLPAST